MADKKDKRNSLDAVLKQVNKKYGDNTVITANMYPKLPRFKTGILPLDLETGGGIPKGRITMLYGNESTGKSFIAQKTVIQAQRTCRHCGSPMEEGICTGCDNGEPHVCVYEDVEGTFDRDWFVQIGGDLSSLIIIQPEFTEQSIDITEALVRTGDVDLIVIDSLAMLSPMDELEKSAEDQIVGTHAKLLNRMMRAISSGFNSLGMMNMRKPGVILINQTREKVGVNYGCIHGETLVCFADGRRIPIRKVVKDKIQGNVFCLIDGEVHTRPIDGWHHNGYVTSKEDYIHFEVRGIETANGIAGATVTREHLVHTDAGWVKAEDLTVGSLVTSCCRSILSGTLLQFLLGTLVGDSHMHNVNGSSIRCLVKLQDNSNPEYANWKVEKLKALDFRSVPVSVHGKPGVRYDSAPSYELASLKERFPNRNPVPFLYGEHYSDMGLAIWYMDDGHFDSRTGHYRSSICLKRMDSVSLSLVVSWFNAQGISVSRFAGGTVWFTAEGTRALFDRIKTYVPKCMEYKLGDGYRGCYQDFELTYSEQLLPVLTPVISKRVASLKQFRARGKYDLTVSGAGNFFVGSTTNGVCVHNSPETIPGGQGQKFAASIRIKLFARPSERVYETIGDKQAVGQVFRFNVEKNKTFSPHREGMYTLYNADTEEYRARKGETDNFNQIVSYGVRYGLINVGGAWYNYQYIKTDENGEIVSEEVVRGQGMTNFILELQERPDVCAQITERVKLAVEASAGN